MTLGILKFLFAIYFEYVSIADDSSDGASLFSIDPTDGDVRFSITLVNWLYLLLL